MQRGAKRAEVYTYAYMIVYLNVRAHTHTHTHTHTYIYIYILMWIETMQMTAVFTVPCIIAVHNIKHIKTPHTQRKFTTAWSHTHWQWKVASTATVNMEFIWKASSNKPIHLYYSSSASRMIPRAVEVLLSFPVREKKKKRHQQSENLRVRITVVLMCFLVENDGLVIQNTLFATTGMKKDSCVKVHLL